MHCRNKKYSDAGMFLNYDDDEDFSQDYRPSKEAFRALTKDDFLKLNISDHDFFVSSNIRFDSVGNNLNVFDLRNRESFTAAQPVQVPIF